MESKDIIVIGGSAGSVNVLLKILPLVEREHSIPILLVIHRKTSEGNMLESILQLKSKIQVTEIEDKMPIKNDTIYVAPANYHVLIENNHEFTLDYSEKVNFSRPNIDVCMNSLVDVYGGKIIGILLSGANEDGAAGLKRISDSGGFTIIQDPESCKFPIMPEAAEKLLKPDLKLTPEQIAEFITNLKN